MRRAMWAAVAAVGLLTVAGCGGPSEAEETACKLFADANNQVWSAYNLWVADGRPDGGSDLARTASARLPDRVATAADNATGDLAVSLHRAAELAAADSEDAELAYYLVEEDIYAACEDLGVDLDLVTPVEADD